jgi:hypothetical protein
MSTSQPAVTRQRAVSISPWIGLALAFGIGTAGGAIAATVIADQPAASTPVAAPAAPAQVANPVSKPELAKSRGDMRLYLEFLRQEQTRAQADLDELIAKVDAAASRGDARLYLQFRNDLAAYLAGVDVAPFGGPR